MIDPVYLKSEYDDNGFVIVPCLISPQDHETLKNACSEVVSRTRSGSWTHRRTVGKQFPPYGDEDPDSWGVQHVMHPDLQQPAFAKWYTSDSVLGTAKLLLGCQENELQMELFNLLINPVTHNFALRWHRDDVKGDATTEEEQNALAIWHHGVQWNTALYEDKCLYVVPGSHKVPRSDEQRKHSTTMEPLRSPLDMPGSIQVTLQPGESVFYNSNILHCATYNTSHIRATLHASMGDVRGGSSRARNVLQHGLDWMKGDSFRAALDDRGRSMLDRLVDMQKGVTSDIGYSLVN